MRHRGFEPRTTWLKVKCSTDWANIPHIIDLHQLCVPRTGIEPVTRGFSVLCSTDCAIWASIFLWWNNSRHKKRVAGAGFEPTTFGLWARRASRLLHPATIFNWQMNHHLNGWRWIRTTEAICSRFTVCPLWPLGNPSIILNSESRWSDSNR